MNTVVRWAVGVVAAAGVLLAPSAASAAKTCDEPGKAWSRATPAEAGMDGAKLAKALQYGTTQASFAIRVYRNGCLVAEDSFSPANRTAQYESWSMAKSITALVFGRAMTMGLISPDDPVGSLVPEADQAHGKITMRDLLTMTSGLRWNGLRDYDIAMPDRIHDALTVDIAHPAGTFFEYSQSGPALLAEAVQRAVGEDFQAFAQQELFDKIGIARGGWRWTRDSVGHTQGFFGMNMIPDDYARMGELMRRGGRWKGQQLLSQRFVREALTPTATNGCYGWLIWLNAAKPCISPRVTDRPFNDRRQFPELPKDLYRFSGLFGQLVSVFPSQGIVLQRSGQDPDTINFAGGAGWENELYKGVLGSITDTTVPKPSDADPTVGAASKGENPDAGFQTSFGEPGEFTEPYNEPPLPPAGPQRARALRMRLAHTKVSRTRIVSVRATCPARAAAPCAGEATLDGAKGAKKFSLAPGATSLLRFRLVKRPKAPATLNARAVVQDAGGGTTAVVPVTIKP